MTFRFLLASILASGISPLAIAAEDSRPEILTIPSADNTSIPALVYRPDNGAETRSTAIVLLHGGGWRWGEAAWMSARGNHLAGHGFPGISVEYRLSKDGVTPVDAVQDTCHAIAWLRNNPGVFGKEIKRVVAYGMSAGGHLAAATVTAGCPEAGEPGRADALLLWSPALAVEKDGWFQRLLGDTARAEDWSPNTNLNDELPPTAIVIGDKDTLTPMQGSEVFCKGVREAGSRCEMFVYSGVGHLLTRNLENQESDFDVDPEMVQDGSRKLLDFLLEFESGEAAGTLAK